MMLKNYLVTALRNIKKQFGYSLINITGLAIGMACCILILLWVNDELSYDRFHKNSDRIFRVTRQYFDDDGALSMQFAHNAFPLAALLKSDFSEIEEAARFLDGFKTAVTSGEKTFIEERIYFADAEVFDVFTLAILEGKPRESLENPYTVVLTEDMAEKYFPNGNVLGRSMIIDVYGRKVDLEVEGVIETLPHNSHFHPDFLVSMKTFEATSAGYTQLDNWGNNQYPTYVLLSKAASAPLLEQKLKSFVDRHLPENQKKSGLTLQKLTDIHLRSNLDSEIEPVGDIAYVYIFTVTAVFILLIACINFMNLATARSARRAREVGVRKAAGAQRIQLIRQFLCESMFLSFLSLFVALVLVLVFLPWFNRFIHKGLSLDIFNNLTLALLMLGIAAGVGLLSGIYPSFFLSAFQPAHVLKGALKTKVRGISFRSVLVVFQFSISIVLIICMTVVSRQLNFMSNKKLGFNKENVVVLPADVDMQRRLPSIKNQLLDDPRVTSVTATKHVPSDRLLDNDIAYMISGNTSSPVPFRIALLRVDYDTIRTYGMELAAGRDFSVQLATDARMAFILNETAVQRLGWTSAQDALDKPFGYGNRRGRIVGVVKDFHFESLRQEIIPLVMLIRNDERNQVSVRIRSDGISGTIAFLKQKWQEFRPGQPFAYFFIDENMTRLYMTERNLQQIFTLFSLLAIFCACLGLFGLASYTAEQRTKEIGIRKVLGCSVPGIVHLLSWEFLKWVLLANLVAWPLGYSLMVPWLKGFSYRTSISVTVFFLSASLAMVVALLTVGFQALKTATSNPVECLKYE